MHFFDEEFPFFVISFCHFDRAEFFAIRTVITNSWLLSRYYTDIDDRHGICQKIYTAGFSGQKFYTVNFA